MSKSKKRVRAKAGDVVAIPLGDGEYGFGRIMRDPLMAFYDLKRRKLPELSDILRSPIAFMVWVMGHAVTNGDWPVIGNAQLEEGLLKEVAFYKKDPISGALSIYRSGAEKEVPASREECQDLECAAVWEPNHIVDRLVDHFAGRRNKWLESLHL